MESCWNKRDEQRLVKFVNEGSTWFEISTKLGGRYNSTECRVRFAYLEGRDWTPKDDGELWKRRQLIGLRTHEVSEELRRSKTAVEKRLAFLNSNRVEKSSNVSADHLRGAASGSSSQSK